MLHVFCQPRRGAASHETHQAVQVETARQPLPFLTHVLQAAKQKAPSTKSLLDHSERTLTRMTTFRVDFLSRIGRHLLCMRFAKIFVRSRPFSIGVSEN